MSTNRIQRFSAVGLTVTVSLVLLLAVQVGLTSAATDTSSSMALQGEVNIHLWGPPLGPPDANEGHGGGRGNRTPKIPLASLPALS